MGCTHPAGIVKTTNDHGEIVSARCPACGMSARLKTPRDRHWLRETVNVPRWLIGLLIIFYLVRVPATIETLIEWMS